MRKVDHGFAFLQTDTPKERTRARHTHTHSHTYIHHSSHTVTARGKSAASPPTHFKVRIEVVLLLLLLPPLPRIQVVRGGPPMLHPPTPRCPLPHIHRERHLRQLGLQHDHTYREKETLLSGLTTRSHMRERPLSSGLTKRPHMRERASSRGLWNTIGKLCNALARPDRGLKTHPMRLKAVRHASKRTSTPLNRVTQPSPTYIHMH